MNNLLVERMREENCSLISIDLFSGPGGLCTGFKWAGILPLIAVEWVDTTVETYSMSHNAEVFELSLYLGDNGVVDENYLNNFLQESARSIIIHGDINRVDNDLIIRMLNDRFGIDCVNETVDIVSGGAPCESFSMAGKRTEGDERDGLFGNIVRISRALRTKAILFENVKGIFTKPRDGVRGGIFEHICDTFEDIDAQTSYRLMSRDKRRILLKACNYGVPQARERVFLVSIRRDLDNVTFEYPIPEFGPGTGRNYVTVGEALSDLPRVEMGEETQRYSEPLMYCTKNQRDYVAIMRGNFNRNGIHSFVPQHLIDNGLFNVNSLSVHKGPGHIERKQKLLALIRTRESMKSAFKRLSDEGIIDEYRDLFPKTIYGSRNRRLLDDETSFTVTSHCLDEILHPVLNRAITPREAARLQSFPDWYQFAGPYVQFHGSAVQDKYEQIGDAIPPLLACAMGRQFRACLPPHI